VHAFNEASRAPEMETWAGMGMEMDALSGPSLMLAHLVALVILAS
jgi:hypothetical protein